MLNAYGHYKAGFLPDPGGWSDQAYSYTVAMRFIDQCVSSCERRRMDG